MKRTFRFCALLFCVMLWLTPAGAQQKTRLMPENNMISRLNRVGEFKVAGEVKNLSEAQRKTRLMPENNMISRLNRVDEFKVAGEVKNLSEAQKKEMVRTYMRQAVSGPKKAAGETTAPSIFIIGLTQYSCTGYFSITNTISEAYRIDNINNGQYYCFPSWGAWCGDHYEGYFIIIEPNNSERIDVGYCSYDMVTNEFDLVGLETTEVVASSRADYDPTDNKIYTMTAVGDDIRIYGSTPRTGTYDSVGTLSGVTGDPLTMSIDKTGKIYVISSDGNLYTVSKETWVATLVGNTGIENISNNPQAAAVDYLTQKLYWAYNVSTNPTQGGIAIVDVTTGEAEVIKEEYIWISQMSSLYHVDNNPMPVENFTLAYNADGKVQASFKLPELTINEVEIDQLDTVEIFKVVNGVFADRVWAQQNPVPGETMSVELRNLGNEGENVTLAIRVKDKDNKYSTWLEESVLLFIITLPYENGFETVDIAYTEMTIVAVDPDNKGNVGRVNTESYEGSYSYRISGGLYNDDRRQMVLKGIPVQKDYTYKISFYAKTDVAEDGLLYAFDGAAFRWYTAVYDNWIPIELTYTASATGQMSLTLQGYGYKGGEEFFIDNLKVVQFASSTAPEAMTINSVEVGANGLLQAAVNVTLPDKTIGGQDLTKIDSIVFEYVVPVGSSLDFSLAEKATVTEGLTPGATTDVILRVNNPGMYCLRALIYSGAESHPYYARYVNDEGYFLITPWIGSDMPESISVSAYPSTDGSVLLYWWAPSASHNGYIGTVNYKITDAAGTVLYNDKCTSCSFSTEPLELGLHSFMFEFGDDVVTKEMKVNTLAGIKPGMIYSNVSVFGGAEEHVLNVSADETNSAFSQMIYPATGQPIYIDTLLLFVTAPETGEATQYTKIYMGTTDSTSFSGAQVSANDFVEKDQLTEVFAGTLHFKAGENTLKLPLKGFYYNGMQNLVISVVKPLQEPTVFAAAAYADYGTNRLQYAVSASTDFDEIESYKDYTGTIDRLSYVPAMIATPDPEVKKIKVKVDSMELTPLEGAIITMVHQDGKNINATITTDADGLAAFAYMPKGTYTVRAGKASYIASEKEVTIGEADSVEVFFSLIKAQEVKINGSIQDKGGNKLADVAVKASGLADFSATTNADGEFELQGVYGPGEYTLSFEKAGMKKLTVPFVLGGTDTALAKPYEMSYNILAIPVASVAVAEDDKAVVSWNKPLGEDASTQVDPANGYRVYRGLWKDEFKNYTLLTAQPITNTSFTDADYATLPFERKYRYAVVSDWYGDDLSAPAYTNTLTKITLPYENGFEDADTILTDITIVAVDPDNKGNVGRVNTEFYEGSYSYRISGGIIYNNDRRQMEMEGFPVQKDYTYQVSFYAKTDVVEDGLVYAFDGASYERFYYVYDNWIPIEIAYTASATGQMSLSLRGYGYKGGKEFFIDNLKVVQLASPTAPGPMTINSVEVDENGLLQATVNVTLPDTNMIGQALNKIDSIVFEYVPRVGDRLDFAPAEKATVTTGLTPGATTDVILKVNQAGAYYLQALVYSGEESHPYYAKYGEGDYYYIMPWIGSDMPETTDVFAMPNTEGKVTLSWTTPSASHGGYIGKVNYKITDAAGKVLYNDTNRIFTTAALELGVHTFMFEMSNGIETKKFEINTLAGIQPGMIYNNVSLAGTTEDHVLNVSADASNSAFSQMLYPATGQAMYIDTLLLFVTTPETGEARQYTKIYMGTTDKTSFAGALTPVNDFVEKDLLTEVFADTLRFKAGQGVLKLPLKGFYYNGTQSLVIGVVKPMQDKTAFAAAVYAGYGENRLKYAVSASTDLDKAESYQGYTGTPRSYVPAMVVMPSAAELKTLEVTVEEQATNAALENVVIDITRDADYSDGKNLSTTLTTGTDGKATFAYVPQGHFVVRIRKAGYITVTEKIEVSSATVSPIKISVVLMKAKELDVRGLVQDKGGKKLAGVVVKAIGGIYFETVTNANGEFIIENIYGPDDYTLLFEKEGMKKLSVPFVLGETDTTLAKPFELGYEIMDVPTASVTLATGKAFVKWNKPFTPLTVSWVKSLTQLESFTINYRSDYKYAQRFYPGDLTALNLGNNTKALRFGFVPGSEKAQYSIVLANDLTHELYRAAVPADKLKEGEWCEIDIPAESAAIDVTKELWLIVEVSGETQNNAGGVATTTGGVTGKGDLIFYNNQWYQLSDLFNGINGNTMIRLLVEDASAQIDPVNGYRVYRGLLQNEFKDYTLLTAQPITGTTYVDADYASLPFGQYRYAVVSDWYGDDLSAPTYTNTLDKDMELAVSFKVTSNIGSAKGAVVYMANASGSHTYEAVVNDKDTAVFATKVWRDVYSYEISLPYHQTVKGELNLMQDTVVVVAIKETVLNPELTAKIEDKDVVIDYGVNLHNWFDDVESYEDFAIENIGDYILSEPVVKGGIQGITWTNATEKQSWIVFNPGETTPALNLSAHSGDKMFAAFHNSEKQNNDYLIRPVSKGGGEFNFYYRVYNSLSPESFEVVYSSTTSDLSAFKTVKAYNDETVASWTSVAVEIPEDAKYVGIHCISESALAFMVDDLAYYTEDPAKPTAYELYLDGTKVKDAKADELTYTFQNLEFGEHKVGVKAVYAGGKSELVEKTVTIFTEAMPENLKVAVDERTAVLTWDIPEGIVPKSYKVFLGEEQKAENLTEKTYTFSELKNGTYTAAVVAVYESGESEKATVEFTINSQVDVEDFDMAVRSSVYPNPNDGMFYLKAADKGTVEVYTTNGQLVKRVEIPARGTYSINLQDRAKGLYLLKFATGENTTLFKITVR